jgi:hypothetical protein
MSKVVLYDANKKCWLQYEQPVELVQAFRLEEVVDALRRIEALVNDNGLCAAGSVCTKQPSHSNLLLRPPSANQSLNQPYLTTNTMLRLAALRIVYRKETRIRSTIRFV